ncbi:uncharacterized protein STEHIDRAFT_140771 [Stereum hirsutum FP-91666 SS1]|uniref:uncharacterized protein n=1 Tax=Stereum hirsutum (strain FP-91666) TaxID=721885 RepID=UPI000444A551|nr:uncharacterized protein STEHIDRAFT_140771 [Stereum hirsutum FP-91666 SS1]EIM84611.1 hypothetical protein STEHIDRAFT_140771 [Stereum hirsutum FP-91666 SS1]
MHRSHASPWRQCYDYTTHRNYQSIGELRMIDPPPGKLPRAFPPSKICSRRPELGSWRAITDVQRMTSQFNRFTRGGTALVIDRNRTNGTMPCPSPHSVASDDNCQGVGHLRAPTPLERFGLGMVLGWKEGYRAGLPYLPLRWDVWPFVLHNIIEALFQRNLRSYADENAPNALTFPGL